MEEEGSNFISCADIQWPYNAPFMQVGKILERAVDGTTLSDEVQREFKMCDYSTWVKNYPPSGVQNEAVGQSLRNHYECVEKKNIEDHSDK